MRNKRQKKAQSKINKYVRALNKNIEQDNLWLGRFYVHQIKSEWESFHDEPGGILHVLLEYVDNKTGQTGYEWCTNCNADWHIWWEMNTFITNKCRVWETEGRENLYNHPIDFRGVRRNG